VNTSTPRRCPDPARCGFQEHPGALRPQRRVLRALPRPVDGPTRAPSSARPRRRWPTRRRAKIDLSLGKCELRPGQKTPRRRLRLGRDGAPRPRSLQGQRHRPDAQQKTSSNTTANSPRIDRASSSGSRGGKRSRCRSDRIVSIGAFEHFGRDKYPRLLRQGAFRCCPVTPGEGRDAAAHDQRWASRASRSRSCASCISCRRRSFPAATSPRRSG